MEMPYKDFYIEGKKKKKEQVQFKNCDCLIMFIFTKRMQVHCWITLWLCSVLSV